MTYEFPTAPSYKGSAQSLSIAALTKRVPFWKYSRKDEYTHKRVDTFYVQSDTSTSYEKQEHDGGTTMVHMEVTRVYISCQRHALTVEEAQKGAQQFIAAMVEAGWTVWGGHESNVTGSSPYYQAAFYCAGGGYRNRVQERLANQIHMENVRRTEEQKRTVYVNTARSILKRYGLDDNEINGAMQYQRVSLTFEQLERIVTGAEARNMPVGAWS